MDIKGLPKWWHHWAFCDIIGGFPPLYHLIALGFSTDSKMFYLFIYFATY